MADKQISNGTCAYCKQIFPKNVIKRHLNTCKERQTAQEAASQKSRAKKERLFHIQVEGRALPMYWLHLEVPASAKLADLDQYLRDIWLECCGHLSAFRIDKVSYSISPEEDFFPMGFPGGNDPLGGMFPMMPAPLPPPPPELAPLLSMDIEGLFHKYLAEQRAKVGDETAEAFFQAVLKRLIADMTDMLEKTLGAAIMNDLKAELNVDLKKLSAKDMLTQLDALEQEAIQEAESLPPFPLLFDDFREEDMGSALGDVLKVGTKFDHEYDFGSTTELTLKVLSEREGVALGKKKAPVVLLARNEAPEILCEVCGQPAILVCTNCNWGGVAYSNQGAVCKKCAKKHKCGDDMMLPIVNSPRTGVCGYGSEWV